MKHLQLANGPICTVDDEYYDIVVKHNWVGIKKSNESVYACTRIDGSMIDMSHFILTEVPRSTIIDHINGVTLNNQVTNLRPADKAQNAWNSKLRSDNQSGIKGLSWDRSRNRWRVNIQVRGNWMFLGRFKEREEAVRVLEEARKLYHGEFARSK
jgi:hypothetical protein